MGASCPRIGVPYVACDYPTAATLFKDRIAVNPTTDLSRAYLASTLGHLGKADEARDVWRELMEINPAYDPEAHIGRLPSKTSPTHRHSSLDCKRRD